MTGEGIAAWLAYLTNPNQEDMLKADPAQLERQAEQVMGKAEGTERHEQGYMRSKGLRFAFQAALTYLHQAAVLQDQGGSGVNVRCAVLLQLQCCVSAT